MKQNDANLQVFTDKSLEDVLLKYSANLPGKQRTGVPDRDCDVI